MLSPFIPFVSVEFVQYVGSFAVVGEDESDRLLYIQNKIAQLQESGKSLRVLLVISLSGVKICSCDGQTVHMAHALRRISYATCDPTLRLFAFLARQPKAQFNEQHCHAFHAASAAQAEELNSIVGHAFRLAYAAHLEKSGTALLQSKDTCKRVRISRQGRSKASTQNSTRQLTKCESPFSYHSIKEDGCERSCSSCSSLNSSSHQDFSSESSTMRTPCHISATPSKPTSLPGLCYSDEDNNIFLSPDSDVGNSPTDLNSSKHLSLKPSLTKNVILDANITFEQSNHRESPSCSVISYHQATKIENIRHGECKSAIDHCDQIDVSAFDKLLPPPLPERLDSLTPPEEPHLKNAPWFQAGIPREIALEVLSREPVGAFMVRESTSKPGCYALSLRVSRDFTVSGIAHYLIVQTSKGYKIKGFTKEFLSLTALITHHSVMPELLPCPLSLSRYNPAFNQAGDTGEEDPDYNTLSDFRKMMAELNV